METGWYVRPHVIYCLLCLREIKAKLLYLNTPWGIFWTVHKFAIYACTLSWLKSEYGYQRVVLISVSATSAISLRYWYYRVNIVLGTSKVRTQYNIADIYWNTTDIWNYVVCTLYIVFVKLCPLKFLDNLSFSGSLCAPVSYRCLVLKINIFVNLVVLAILSQYIISYLAFSDEAVKSFAQPTYLWPVKIVRHLKGPGGL